MDIWPALMVIAGGLFAGGAATFGWSRVPIWRRMAQAEFVRDFSQTIDRTDKVQPALLVIAVASALVYGFGMSGLRQVFAIVGAVGLILVLLASLAVLVPLQRRIIAQGSGDDATDLGEMRSQWYRGNLGRTVLSVLSFVALAAAVTVAP